MLYAFAPMEGVTSCLFRRTHAKCFPGVDRYYAPSLAPDAAADCPFPVCYNSSIVDKASLDAVREAVPSLERVMLGRGAAADPALFRVLRGGEPLSSDELLDFLTRYRAALTDSGLGDHYTLGRLKELWFYCGAKFPDNPRGVKRIAKAQNLEDHRSAVRLLFAGGGFRPEAPFIG